MNTPDYARLIDRADLIAAGVCLGEGWQLMYANAPLAAILRIPPGQKDFGAFSDLLRACGFENLSLPAANTLEDTFIAYQRLGKIYIVHWRLMAHAPKAVRVLTMTEVDPARINSGAALPWQELNVLLDSIHDGIWVIDANGVTVRINKAAERIAGLKAEEVIGHHVTEPMRGGRFETCVTLRALTEKRPVTMFDDYANGKRCLNTSTPIFDENGNVWRVIASIRDMTELETLQRKLTDLEMETQSYKERLQNLEDGNASCFVGNSAALLRLRRDVAKAARTEAITLIEGETGTGKTLAAKAIHDQSARASGPFIAVNCGAIPPSLVESELFGYEKGAFTGAANTGKPGMFELAHKGTILLDEIGELPMSVQAKLLQVLDGHPFLRVGGTRPITSDARVLAATNRKLSDMVSAGQFREDLFYRLRVLTLEIPPLRHRVDDIPILAMYFLNEICTKNNLTKAFDPAVLNCLLTYSWPGNVRELRAIVYSLATMSENTLIMPVDLPEYLQPSLPETPPPPQLRSLPEAVAELERTMIMVALSETGSTYKAAERLKVSQSTVVRKAQRYHINLTGTGPSTSAA